MTYLQRPDKGEKRWGRSSGRVDLPENMLKDRFNQVESQDVLNFLKTKRWRESVKVRIKAVQFGKKKKKM